MAILNFDNIGVAGRDGWQRLFLFNLFNLFKVFKVFNRSTCSLFKWMNNMNAKNHTKKWGKNDKKKISGENVGNFEQRKKLTKW